MRTLKQYVKYFLQIVAATCFVAIQKYWNISGTAFVILILIRWMYGGAFLLILINLTAIGIMYDITDYVVYQPDTPSSARLYVEMPPKPIPSQSFFIVTKDKVKIHAMFIQQANATFSSSPTILYLHGNAGNIGHRLPSALDLYRHVGANILLLEWRGYGKSDGAPSEEGLYLDAQAGLDHLISRSDIDKRKVVVFGRSLGGAVAIHLASQSKYDEDIAAVVLENTFTSIQDMGQNLVPFLPLSLLPSLVFKNKYDSLSKISALRVPALFISGLKDSIIPSKMMKTLHQTCASEVKKLETFPTGDHNDTWLKEGYLDRLNSFLNKVFSSN